MTKDVCCVPTDQSLIESSQYFQRALALGVARDLQRDDRVWAPGNRQTSLQFCSVIKRVS